MKIKKFEMLDQIKIGEIVHTAREPSRLRGAAGAPEIGVFRTIGPGDRTIHR